MAASRRRAGAAVNLDANDILGELLESPWKFEFFQAVRILERECVAHITQRRKKLERGQFSPVGGDGDPATEAVRFGVPPSLSFPAAEIAGVVRKQADAGDGRGWLQPELDLTFFGLSGPSGVLPYHYTTSLIRLARERDHASAEFFDLFNHRLISLFYRAWEKYRFPMALERTRLVESPEDDDFTAAINSLAGFGTPGLRGRMAFEDDSLAYFAGHLSRHPRPAISLELMLQEYFGYPASLVQFMGQWLTTAEADHSCLGGFRLPGRNITLGSDVVLGERVWDVSARFRVRVGPLTYAQYKRLLPDGEDHLPIIHMVRTVAGAEMDFDIEPTLLADEVPQCQLQSAHEPYPRLGWNTWLLSGKHAGDFTVVIFESGPNSEPEKLLETKEWAA
jgi:type VI secretion system protein ImpH